MHADTYICCKCGEDIVDHVYLVQRRRIRPVKEILPDGKVKYNRADAIDSSHAGIILGPEHDPYCPQCYSELPSIKELIDANKKRLDTTG